MSTRLGPNAYAAWDTFTSRGVPDYVASALVGNMLQESGRKVGEYFDLTPDAEGDEGNSRYAVQWNGPRRKAYEAWTAQRGTDPTDIREQALRVLVELGTTEKKAFDAIFSADSDPERVAAIAAETFWRPGDPRTANRMRYARMAADQFKIAQNTTQANDAASDPVADAVDSVLGTSSRSPAAAPADPVADVVDKVLADKIAGTVPGMAPAVPAVPTAPAPVTPERRAQVIDEYIAKRREEHPIRARLEDLGQQYLQGTPFIGESLDEFIGQAGPHPVFGIETGTPLARDVLRRRSETFREKYPVQSTVAGLVGGVVNSLPAFAAFGPGILARAPTGLLAKTATTAASMSALGALEGAISGYLEGKDTTGNRMDSAVQRAAISALVGGVLGGATPAVAEAAKRVFGRLRAMDIGGLAVTLGVSKDAAGLIKMAMQADDPRAAAILIRKHGPEAMLADAGPAAKSLLDTSLQQLVAPAEVRAAIKTRLIVEERQTKSVLNGMLGRPRGVMEVADEISSSTAVARQKAFDAAFATPIPQVPVGGPGDEINRVLSLIPADFVQDAVRLANREISYKKALDPNFTERAIKATIAPNGTVTYTELPTVRQLHFLKMALQGMAEDSKNPITKRLTQEGVIPGKFGTLLRDLIVKATGGDTGPYAKAMKLGGDKIAMDDALLLGRTMFLPGTTREDVAKEIAGMDPATKRRAAEGLRGAIDETLANVKRTIANPDVEAGQLVRMVKDMSSPANREKLTLLLGGTKARIVFEQLEKAGAALELQAAVAQNSRTAPRRAVERRVEEMVDERNVFQHIFATFQPLSGKRGVYDALTDYLSRASPSAKRETRDEIYRDLARALTLFRGTEAQKALSAIRSAINGQTVLSQGQVELIADALAVGLAIPAYQAGVKKLETLTGTQ